MELLHSLVTRLPGRLRVAAVVGALAVTAAACGSSSYGSHSAAPAPGSAGGAAAVRSTRNTALGHTILVGAGGRTLYLFEKDANGKSSCSGSCASLWPPLLTSGKPHAGSGVTASMLGSITRADGKTQVTYAGHPLYYYAADSSAGQANGQGLFQFGAKWYVVSPQGSALTGTKPAGGGGAYGSGSSTPSSTSNGSSWG